MQIYMTAAEKFSAWSKREWPKAIKHAIQHVHPVVQHAHNF